MEPRLATQATTTPVETSTPPYERGPMVHHEYQAALQPVVVGLLYSVVLSL